MDVTKAAPSQPTQASESAKRLKEKTQATANTDAIAAKRAYEATPRPTTNTRGEVLGKHVNTTA